MTKEEFSKFINSFNRKPGDYSEEEIYKIGVEHKKLDQGSKSWAKLADTLGLEKSGDALRSWVNTRQIKDGTLPKNVRLISSRTINDLDENMASDNITAQIGELYKQQTKTRDTLNAYRRTLRNEARIESFKDSIVEAIGTLEPLEKKPYKGLNDKNDKVEAVLMLSDLHIGVECDNFYNKYNSTIAKHRIERLVDRVKDYCIKNKVYRLNILNMGDLIHGVIHVSARLEQEMEVTRQIVTASEILSYVLNELQTIAPEVTYRSVVDNHSRVTASLHEHIEAENMNKLIDWWLEERLKGSRIIFKHDNIDEGIGLFELMNGEKVIFAHGHNDSFNSSLQSFVGATGSFVKYVLLAHMHSEKMKAYQSMKVFVNGSVVGTEQYALSKRLFNKPSQTLLVFDEKDLLNISVDLDINE